ncbi:hypothetical protein ACMD47_001826 [Serratia marcescens]|uniref:hypothetical protein n=1 Tax=Serratia sarumanii TaxID=3020826 RepID=UPI002AD12AF9|nr:hypothetical protein [Serratia marcescens]EMC1043128.1 hypothetical protein [Serratia marcescens]HBV0684984.1 hypothetical protein [Serratia marcescens]
MDILQHAVEKLCNALRLNAEEAYKFDSLVKVDKEEAVANIDATFERVLETFHSLYDVSKNKIGLNFLEHSDTSLIIVLRNAIHHRDHPLFRSWHFVAADDAWSKRHYGASLLLSNYDTFSPTKPYFIYYYKLMDLFDRLDPERNSDYQALFPRKPEERSLMFKGMCESFGFEDILNNAAKERYPLKQVYFNVYPILHSALVRVFGALKATDFEPKGYDTGVYIKHFSTECIFNLKKPVFKRYYVQPIKCEE